MLFSWVGRALMQKGASQESLSSDDLLHLDTFPALEPSECSKRMWKTWKHEIRYNKRGHQLLNVILTLHGGHFVLLALLKLTSDSLGFAAPLILKHLVEWLSLPIDRDLPQRPMEMRDLLPSGRLFGLLAGLLLGLSCLLRAVITSQYNWRMGMMQCELRASIMCLLYKKALSVSSSSSHADSDKADDKGNQSKGGGEDVSTLMSVDAGRVVNLFVSLNEIWGLPFQLIIALVLLYLQVRWAFLAGLALSILLIPINRLIATRIVAASTSMMKFKDQRLQLINELLKGIRAVKMMAWEGVFVDRIKASRKGELEGLAVRKYLDALCVYLWASTGQLISTLMFGIMAANGSHVSPGAAFAALSLFQGLIGPLNALPWVLNGVLEALVSINRVQSFLLRPEARSNQPSSSSFDPPPDELHQLERGDENQLLHLYPDCLALAAEISCSWHPVAISAHGESTPHQPCLNGVSLIIPQGSMVVIVGPVGSGKSSLLSTLAGELKPYQGRCEIKQGIRVGFVPQTPWCLSGTVRENVCLAPLTSPEEEERYQRVVEACALVPDLAAMKDGDLTSVGERGSTLSGGQRARLALARALFQSPELFLIDDVLTSVDDESARHIVRHALLGSKGLVRPSCPPPTMVIASKSTRLIQAADLVIALNKGKVTFRGSPGDYLKAYLNTPERMRSPDEIEIHPSQLTKDIEAFASSSMPSLQLSNDISVKRTLLLSTSPPPGPRTASSNSQMPKSKIDEPVAVMPSAVASSKSGGDSSSSSGIMSSPLLSWNQPQVNPRSASKKMKDPKTPPSQDPPAQEIEGSKGPRDENENINERQVGHVKWRVYKAYFSSVGYPTVVIVALTLLLMQGTKNASDVWVGLWVSEQNPRPDDALGLVGMIAPVGHLTAPAVHNHASFLSLPFSFAWSFVDQPVKHHPPLSPHLPPTTPSHDDSPPLPPPHSPPPHSSSHLISNETFLHVLLILAALNSLFTLGRAFSFAFAGMSAAKTTHEKLLSAILAAPMSFFDSVSSGQIVNRFSSDASKVDDSLPFIFNIFLANLVTLLGLLAVMTLSSPALLLFLIPSAFFYLRLSTYYRSTSREVRRLDSASLAPVYSSFSEVSDAAPCVRGFGLQDLFYRKHVTSVRSYQRASISGCAAGIWLGVRLQLLAALLVTCVAFLAVLAHEEWLPTASWTASAASLAGLSLAYALPIVGVLDGLLIYSAETEQEMVAVERIDQYLAIKPQLDRSWPWADVSLQEPDMPVIKFQDVYLRYKPGLPFALSGLSLSIRRGEKVGVVGRTGAGKSTLVGALLRLVEVDSGSILLWGRDIRSMNLHQLRSSFGVVPQSPLILGGATVRDNLDPSGKRTSQELVAALKSVQLWQHLSSHVSSAKPARSEEMVQQLQGVQGMGSSGGLLGEGSSQGLATASSLVSLRDLEPPGSFLPIQGRDEEEGRVGDLLGVSPDSIVEVESSKRRQARPRDRSWDLWTRPWKKDDDDERALRSPLLSELDEAGHEVEVASSDFDLENSVLSLKVQGEAGTSADSAREEGGWVGLSHGQKQLLCLARMLLKRSSIVLLDEISASVDPATARLIHEVLDSELKTQGTTVVQIAHDVSVLSSSDRIVTIENGAAMSVA